MIAYSREAATRIRDICLNLLLDGIACMLGYLDNNFMRRLLGLRGAPCQSLEKLMPMQLPDASFCTSWAARSGARGFIDTPACMDEQGSGFHHPR